MDLFISNELINAVYATFAYNQITAISWKRQLTQRLIEFLKKLLSKNYNILFHDTFNKIIRMMIRGNFCKMSLTHQCLNLLTF